MLTVTLLGTAATMPLPERALTAAVAECKGRSLLFDCGEGTQAAAHRHGVNLMKLDAVCLTHYHGDHIFGLPGLLQTLACQGRTRPLYLFGPQGLAKVFAPLRALAGPLPYAVNPVQMGSEAIKLPELLGGWPAGAQLCPIATRHRVPSCGYRLELPRAGRFMPEKARQLCVPIAHWKLLQQGQPVTLAGGRTALPAEVMGEPRRGLSFVFSGDTAPCAALETAARGASLLICDATYAEPEQAEQARRYGHSTFGQSAQLAARAGAERLWLAHYSPMITEPESVLHYAQAEFAAAECGFDGKSAVLRYPDRDGGQIY